MSRENGILVDDLETFALAPILKTDVLKTRRGCFKLVDETKNKKKKKLHTLKSHPSFFVVDHLQNSHTHQLDREAWILKDGFLKFLVSFSGHLQSIIGTLILELKFKFWIHGLARCDGGKAIIALFASKRTRDTGTFATSVGQGWFLFGFYI